MAVLIVILFASVSVLLFTGIQHAHRYQRTRIHFYLNQHRTSMKAVFYLVLIGVLVIEGAIRAGFIPSGEHEMLWLHLLFAVPFVVLTGVMVFWKDGVCAPRIHKKLAYGCIGTFAGTLVTGLIFLFT